MREKWPIPQAPVLLAGAALVVIAAIIVALIASQQKEEPEVAQSAASAQSATQPASAPAEPAAAAAPTQEPAPETPSQGDTASTEEPATAETVMEEYVSMTEFFSVQVPAGWISEETFPGGAFITANSEAALSRFNNGGAVESGDLVLNIGFLPYELFRQREVVPLGIQFDAPPDLFLQSVLPVFRFADNAIVSAPELVALSDEREAGLVTLSDEGREGIILMFEAGDEVVAFVSAVGFPGELAPFQELTYAVAAGVAFSGAQEALYGTLLGG